MRSETPGTDAAAAAGASEGPDPFDVALEAAVERTLTGLLHALDLDATGDDRFRAGSEPGRFDRVFGGQLVAQALTAAGATVDGKDAHSIHAYFVEAGALDQPLELVVDRVRDGRSMATRRVTVAQDGRPLLVAIASFHADAATAVLADAAPAVPGPHGVPRLQQWVLEIPPEERPRAMAWIDQPPPLDLRIAEAPNFMGGPAGHGTRSHWMRVPRDVGDDPLLHRALLAYASDYLLLDMAFRSHPERVDAAAMMGFSLDHTVWFHLPVRFDRWHLHTQETVAIGGPRGLVRGAVHDADGALVATVMQEVLVRPAR